MVLADLHLDLTKTGMSLTGLTSKFAECFTMIGKCAFDFEVLKLSDF